MAQQEGQPGQDGQGRARLAGVSVLVIDDAADARDLLAAALTELGAVVATAASGAEGLAQAHGAMPRLVVLDLVMEPMDGWETLRLLRLEDEGLPVVIVSSRDRPQDKIRALQEGALDYIVKPQPPRQIAARIAGVLLPAATDGPTVDGGAQSSEGLALDGLEGAGQ